MNKIIVKKRLHGYSCNQIPIVLVFSIQALTDRTKLLLPAIFRRNKNFYMRFMINIGLKRHSDV